MAKQTIYYSDPLQDDFAGNHIRGKVVDQNFPFLHRSRLWELGSFLVYYGIAVPLVFLICKIYLGMKFENHRQLRQVGRSGYFLYGNHTHGCISSCHGGLSQAGLRGGQPGCGVHSGAA